MNGKTSPNRIIFNTDKVHVSLCLDSSKQSFSIYEALSQANGKGLSYARLEEQASMISLQEFDFNHFSFPVPFTTFMKDAFSSGEIVRSNSLYALSDRGKRVLNYLVTSQIEPYRQSEHHGRTAAKSTKEAIKKMMSFDV